MLLPVVIATPFRLVVGALLLVFALQGTGLALFLKGFLLSRHTLETENVCERTREDGVDPSCTLTPTHSKVVFVIIDALRADFVFPVADAEANPFFHNVLRLPAELTAVDPAHSLLVECIADPPTTTLQRIKGLTTGSLPTFVDAGSNFAGEKVTEDSWLQQAKRAGRRIGFLGDNTWLSVFPQQNGSADESVWDATLTYPYDSFNVEDLDTVDNGVRVHLIPLLDNPQSWDILIAHTLGLDHAGHRFGPDHAETTRKLREADTLLRDVVSRIDDDTLLVVLGDHGMTSRGDHGGDSDDELRAALWVYSKGEQLTSPEWYSDIQTGHPAAELFAGSAERAFLGERPFSTDGRRSVAQIDLVPSLSLLLGLPVPFSSLGAVIPELFFRSSSALLPKEKPSLFSRSSHESLTPHATLLHASSLVASTLEAYLNNYTTSDYGADLRPYLSELYFTLSLAQSAYKGTYAPNVKDPESRQDKATALFDTYVKNAREKARTHWATFDDTLLVKGLVVLGMSVISSVLLGLSALAPQGSFSPRHLVTRALGFLEMAIVALPGVLLASRFSAPLSLSDAIFLLALAPSVGLISFLPKAPFRISPSVVPLLAHATLLGSNSFTVFEDDAVLYLALSILLLYIYKAFSAPVDTWRQRILVSGGVAAVATRALSFIRACREEQAGKCSSSFYARSGAIEGLVTALVSLGVAILLPMAVQRLFALSKADQSYLPLYLGVVFRLVLVLGALYSVADWSLAAQAEKAVLTSVKNGLALSVLITAAMILTVLWYFLPVCITLKKRITDSKTTYEYHGFSNSLAATYAVYFLGLFGFLFLVSTGYGHLALALHLIIFGALLELFDTERDVAHLQSMARTLSPEAFLSSEIPVAPHRGLSFSQVSLLALLGHISFFATGHQATLASIQWSTAFIGFEKVTYPFSPLLVISNTLGSFILTAAVIPLFVLWQSPPVLNRASEQSLMLRYYLKSALGLLTYFGVVTFVNALTVAYLRRHLMVWKVFAPRFFLSGLALLAINVTLIVASTLFGIGGIVAKSRRAFGTLYAE